MRIVMEMVLGLGKPHHFAIGHMGAAVGGANWGGGIVQTLCLQTSGIITGQLQLLGYHGQLRMSVAFRQPVAALSQLVAKVFKTEIASPENLQFAMTIGWINGKVLSNQRLMC
jgi:hypothetical protein